MPTVTSRPAAAGAQAQPHQPHLGGLRILVIIVIACVVVAVAGVYALMKFTNIPMPFLSDTCRVYGSGSVVKLKPSQLSNAATITAVGARMGIEEDGVAVALATAYQESKLQNLESGDRDSIGLFQQRPSQGWGSVDQLKDPRFASQRFYESLLKIPGWQQLRITEAAQAVQKSGQPEAYERWANQARSTAAGLYGTQADAVTCKLRDAGDDKLTGAKAMQAMREEFALDRAAMTTTVADTSRDVTVTVPVESDGDGSGPGWRAAHWFVAKSRDYGIRDVRYAGSVWSAHSGEWSHGGKANPEQIKVHIVS